MAIACSTINAIGIFVLPSSRSAIEGAHFGRLELTKVTRVFMEWSMDRITITFVLQSTITVIWNAL